MDVLLECMYMHHLHGWYPDSPEKVFSLLELELHVVATHHVCGRNWTEPGSPERPEKYSVSKLIFKIDMKILYSMRMILKILRCIVAACWEAES